MQEETGVDTTLIETLFQRYGTRGELIVRSIADSPDADAAQPLTHKPDYYRGEITFLAQQEQVTHLDDLILRRTMLGMLGQLSPGLLDELVEIVGQAINWSSEQSAGELARAYELLRERHGVVLIGPKSHNF